MLKRVLKYSGTVIAIVFLGCFAVEFAAVRQLKVTAVDKPKHSTRSADKNVLNYKRYSEENEDRVKPLIVDFSHKNKSTKLHVGRFVKRIASEKEIHKEPQKMQAIVIAASFRTGSSFVGQLFNQHPQVFYLFEPLFFSIWNRPGGQPTSKVIEDLLLCNMTSMRFENFRAWKDAKHVFEKEKNRQNFKKMHNLAECLKTGLCFRGKSNALCTKEMCRNYLAKNCQTQCYRPPELRLRESCANAKVRVLKVIRVENLSTLERSCRNKRINLKVIHLVRDPRSTLLSRLRLRKTVSSDVAAVVKSTCQRNFRMHSNFLSNHPKLDWLKGRYKLVRYEDIIENPIQEVKKLYNFLNMPDFSPSPDVTTWLQSSTSSTDFDLFSTNRDTDTQKYKWRLQLPFYLAEAVQRECKDMMDLLGYKPAISRSHLFDMNSSLLTEIN